MPLPPEFIEFYENWTAKVASYTEPTARACFDRFLTQFVIYNRLYCEATKRLCNSPGSGIRLDNRTSFPDATAAKEYVALFLGARSLIESLEQDQDCCEAINELKRILQVHQFFVKLHPVSGERQHGEDDNLLDLMNAAGYAERARAILDFIYSVRCNMMHGQKNFSEEQRTLLDPTMTVLQKICELIYQKLDRVGV